MKRLRLAALLIGLSPTLAPAAVKNATKALLSEGTETDIPATVGIEADLPQAAPGSKLGHWGVGNGGDWMRIGFARARDYAANVVLRINPLSLSRLKDDTTRQWILTNQKFLAADILQTEHVWVTEAKPTCAFTVPPGDGPIPTSNPIQFSYETCRTQLKCASSVTPTDPNAPIDFLEVAQLLIHEAAHHFNADETTADKIAIAIIDAWQSGMMDSIPLGMTNAPAATYQHSAVWTGDRMIVVGGTADKGVSYVRTVSSYDPVTRVWTDITPPSSISFTPRMQPAIVWTGTEVLIWGGYIKPNGSQKWTYDGVRYNPSTNTWRPIKAPNWATPVSIPKFEYPWQTMVWTGDRAIVWGSYDTTGKPLGGIYDPATDSWQNIRGVGDKDGATDPNIPRVLQGHSAVWTGSKMLIWGGVSGHTLANASVTDFGASYDPATNTWKKMTVGNLKDANGNEIKGSDGQPIPSGSPASRAGHQAVWTGNRMVIISGGGAGTSTDLTSTGALYDPSTDTWTGYKSELMVERFAHRAVWNGEEILILGGQSNRLSTFFGEVYAFNPMTMRWRLLTGSVTPPGRSYSSIVWTGSSALVWGGTDRNGTQNSGAQYFP